MSIERFTECSEIFRPFQHLRQSFVGLKQDVRDSWGSYELTYFSFSVAYTSVGCDGRFGNDDGARGGRQNAELGRLRSCNQQEAAEVNFSRIITEGGS